MLSELIRALPVAVLVGIVPGYSWAKCPSSSVDLYERITYSTPLSMTLVPTAALIVEQHRAHHPAWKRYTLRRAEKRRERED